jgi:hypothetical protein
MPVKFLILNKQFFDDCVKVDKDFYLPKGRVSPCYGIG